MTREIRSELNEITSAQEFRRWYWLKEELVAYCKCKGISTVGGKFEIADRIAEYLATGPIIAVATKLCALRRARLLAYSASQRYSVH